MRNSRIEWLRILAMFFIIIGHIIIKIPLFNNIESLIAISSAKLSVVYVLSAFGKVGVVIFILIAGYFASGSYQAILKRTSGIYATYLFWSLVMLMSALVTIKLGYLTDFQLDFGDIMTQLMPFIFSRNWFVTNFILLMLISPILIKGFDAIGRSNQDKIIIIGFIFLVLLGSLPNLFESPLLIFMYLFIFGYYLKINEEVIEKVSFKQLKWLQIIVVVIAMVITIGLILLGKHLNNNALIMKASFFNNQNDSFVPVILGATIFIHAIKQKVYINHKVNRVASTMFGVYIIHDSPRAFVYKTIDKITNISDVFSLNIPSIIGYLILITVCLLCICGLMELARQALFNKLDIQGKLEKIFNKLSKKISAI